MNTNLKSSTFSPENSTTSLRNSRKSLALVKSTGKLDRPTQLQKKAISRIYAEQAWIYFQEQNWQNAVVACKNALEADAHNADAYKILGNILKRKGKRADALGVYAKALQINPNSAAIYANLGSFYAEQQDWQQALEYYEQAVILDPNFAGAYRSLAQVWEELGDINRALECLCQAVNLEPEKLNAREYFSFGKQLYQQGKLREASIFYIRGVNLDPTESELARLVKILEELEEWQQAVVYYHKLISLSDRNLEPSNLPVEDKPIRNLLSRAKIHQGKNRISTSKQANQPVSSTGAIEASKTKDSSTLKALTPSSTKLLPQLTAAETEADLATAKSLSSRSLSLNQAAKILPKVNVEANQILGVKQPDSAASWNNLGSLYAQKQQWTKAISCYQEAVELDPSLSKSYRNLARIYSKVGKKDRAILCWYEAFILEPSLVKPEEYFNLAKSLGQLNQIDKAIACLNQTIERKPDFEPAHLLLGKLYQKQGKKAEAKACYEKIATSG